MKNKKEIIILVGNIGTGKSTLVRKYVDGGYIAIARDMLRYAIGDGKYIFNPKYERVIFKTELYMFRKFLELGKNIIIDEVGINNYMRSRYIAIIKSYYPKYKIIGIELPKLTMKEAVDRRMNNPHQQADRKLWEEVWKKFNSQYEKPIKKEGFDKIIRMK